MGWKTLFETFDNPFQETTPNDEEYVKKEWLKDAIRFTIKWLDMGVVPIWIIDGTSPASKNNEKEKRRKAQDSALVRMEELKEQLAVDADINDNDLVTDVWMLDSKPTISIEDRKKIVSWRQQQKSLNRLWIHELKNVFTELGIPFVQAVDEGERAAYMLQYDERVDAVFSTDSDLLAYGCSIAINSFKVETKASKRVMPYYNLKYILSALELTQEEFLEFCILCGTDFNHNIEKIGPVKAYELIKSYKAIKNLPSVYKKIPLDVEVLNYDECIRIFSRVPSNDLIETTNIPTLEIDKFKWENCSTFLVNYFGKSSANWLLQDMKRVSIP